MKKELQCFSTLSSQNITILQPPCCFSRQKECYLQQNPVLVWLNIRVMHLFVVSALNKFVNFWVRSEMAMITMKYHHLKRVGVGKDKNWLKAFLKFRNLVAVLDDFVDF